MNYTVEYIRCICLDIQSVHAILYIYVNAGWYTTTYTTSCNIKNMSELAYTIMTCMYLYSDTSATEYVHTHEPSHRGLTV